MKNRVTQSFYAEVDRKTHSHIDAMKNFPCLKNKAEHVRSEIIEKGFTFLLITVNTKGKVLSCSCLHKKPKNAVNLLQLKTKQEEIRA